MKQHTSPKYKYVDEASHYEHCLTIACDIRETFKCRRAAFNACNLILGQPRKNYNLDELNAITMRIVHNCALAAAQ